MLIIFLILSIIACYFSIKWLRDYEMSLGALLATAFSIILIIGVLIVSICCIYTVSGEKTIDAKIAMYEEENNTIDENIRAIVSQYQQYETDIFTDISDKSVDVLVQTYPELKSDTLVQTQMKTYTDNRATILRLKEKKIAIGLDRW